MISRADQARDSRENFARWSKDGRGDRYVPATTMCWFPRLPHRLRARREGFETVIPCGDCPGCREFDALRLARRLVETHRDRAAAAVSGECQGTSHKRQNGKSDRPQLFAVRIDAAKEKHAELSRLIHRWRGVEVEPGFFRAGVESFVVLSSAPGELEERLRRRRLRFVRRPMGRLDRLKSWRHVVCGLLVARSAYGEHINRFYRRGLAPLEKINWEIGKNDVYTTYHRATSPRAISQTDGELLPPSMWQLPRGSRRSLHGIFNRATTPEQVDHVMPEVLALVARIGKPLIVSAVPKTAEEIERNRRFNIRFGRMEPARTDDPIGLKTPPLSFQGEVTELLVNSGSTIEAPTSSIHTSGAPPPRSRESIRQEAEAAEAAIPARAAFLAQRTKKKLDDAFASLLKAVDRRSRETTSTMDNSDKRPGKPKA